MVTRTFLHRNYAAENPDLAEKFGAENDAELRRHFQRYGHAEMRGGQLGSHSNVERILLSNAGDVLISGWVDRRMVQNLQIEIEIGYFRYALPTDDLVWYHRPDVATQTGDADHPAGFFGLFKIDDVILHPRVRVLINGRVAGEDAVARWKSQLIFLNQALATVASLADQPIGSTIAAASKLAEPFQHVWLSAVEDMRFTLAFENRGQARVERSIVILLYRQADMLMVQLETLAPYLEASATEVVVVGNDLVQPGPVVEDLNAFCMIHDVPISLHLCSGNSGFSHGNNYGASVARGETLIFMNPDVFPASGAAAQSFAYLDSDPGDTMHGALLYYGDGMLMHSGMYTASDLVFDPHLGSAETVLRVEHFGKGRLSHVDDPQDSVDHMMAPVRDYRGVMATAALCKINKRVFDEFDGLSLDYIYAYYEDADLCMRLLEAGRTIVIDDNSRWIHMEGVGKAHPPHVRSFMWLNRAIYSSRFQNSVFVASRNEDLTHL